MPKKYRKSLPPIELLEDRRLFHAVTISTLPNINVNLGAAAQNIALNQFFDNEDTNGTLVRLVMEHVSGSGTANIDIDLTDSTTPQTVANFLNYVKPKAPDTVGRFDDTFVHRSVAGFIVQFGGYKFVDGTGYNHIVTDPAVQNEFLLSNTRGTVAMAKVGGDPNSATSEFFVNIADNSSNLDNQNGGFTVFGHVTPETLPVVDTIAGLPNFQVQDSPFDNLPLFNYTSGGITSANLVNVKSASVIPELNYTVTSDNAAVSGSINNGVLTLNYSGTVTGLAHVTVTADATTVSSSVSQTFNVQVGSTNQASVGDGANKAVMYKDADGTTGTITVKSGRALIAFFGDNLTQTVSKKGLTVSGANVSIDTLTLNTSTAKTALTITAKGGNGTLDVGTMVTNGMAGSISAKTTVMRGNTTLGGSLKTLDLGTYDGGTITIAADGGQSVAITGTTFTDTVIQSFAPIKSIKATAFLSSDTTDDVISAPAIGDVSTKGEMANDVTSTASIGNVTAGTQLHAVKIVAGSTIKAVTAASIIDSRIEAGLNPLAQGVIFPTQATDYKPGSAITSVTAKGGKTIAVPFSNTTIIAASIGKLTLGNIQTTNGGNPFGIAADKITAFTATLASKKLSLKKLDDPTKLDGLLTGFTLGDLRIVMV